MPTVKTQYRNTPGTKRFVSGVFRFFCPGMVRFCAMRDVGGHKTRPCTALFGYRRKRNSVTAVGQCGYGAMAMRLRRNGKRGKMGSMIFARRIDVGMRCKMLAWAIAQTWLVYAIIS